jgi:prephenate dehydrogenase
LHRVAVIGCGLIGGSIELAARERIPGIDLVTLDRGDALSAAADSDLIVLATPIGEMPGLLGGLAPILSSHSLITDTGSTKARIVAAARGLRFIGGHPIAGAATSGRSAARSDLFAGRPWVLTPGVDADPLDVERLRSFVQQLGATPHILAADEHDRLLAFISHLPQLVVSALMDIVGSSVGAEGLALAGLGLRDTTRLAGSPPDIWRDIVRTNDGNIGLAIDALLAALVRLRADSETLPAMFESAARWRAVLEGAESAKGAEGETHGDTEDT